jgi:hypothetical protein
MLHKMSILRHKAVSCPFPRTLPFHVDINNMLWKLADRYKCAHPIGVTLPTPPLSLCTYTSWDGKLDFGVDYR